MTFEDLKESGFLLKINAEGFEELSFPVEVLSIKMNTVVAKPIEYEGKVVSFDNKTNISAEIWSVAQDRPPYVAKAKCVYEKAKGVPVLIIMGLTAPIKQNKRGAYRVNLYLSCNVALGLTNPFLGEVVNGSETGFAVKMYTDKEIKPLKDVVKISFSDKDIGDGTYMLTGLIVRKEEKDDGAMVLGCRILESPSGYRQYIVKKQSKKCLN